MTRLTTAFVLVAVLVGLLGGYLWWGASAGRVQRELQEARASSDRLAQQVQALQDRDQQRAAELQVQKTRLEATERDLKVEREMNGRLHLLVSQGKK